MSQLPHYLLLLRVFVAVSLLNELQYRVNFAFQVVHTALSLTVAGAGLAIIFSHTTTLGGWRVEELVMLMGVYYVVLGLMSTFITPGMEQLMDDVRKGTLDYTLTKPVASQFIVSFRQVIPWRLTDVVLGTALVVASAIRLGADIGLAEVAAFLVALGAGTTIVYSFRLLLATLTFWLIRVENIMVIFSSLYEAGRYPVGLYPDWLRALLTFVVPVAFATTVPAEALAGRLTATSLAVTVGVALLLFAAASALWKFGLRHYTGASA
ncbi:MAG: ABC-2 family transporter protein [Chloroflexi bacterium]|nr:ABC-2 family transporter protein [Chloroflexota bacterium]